VVLHDLSGPRLAAIRAVLAEMAARTRAHRALRVATELDEALADARFGVLRDPVDGLAGRTVDERVALAHGVLGRRPPARRIALRAAQRAGGAARGAAGGRRRTGRRVINFTNPAGMITERCSGAGEGWGRICDSPVGLVRARGEALRATGSCVD